MPQNRDDARVSVVGAMSADQVLTLAGPVSGGTVNAVHRRPRFGGAARDIAVCLARLGIPVRLLSLVGDDDDGRALVAATAGAAVDVGLVQKSLSLPTASLVAVERADGSLHAAYADMRICAAMDRGFIQNRWLPISRSPLVVADAWLPGDSLAWLITGCRTGRLPLAIDAVSTATARHLPLALHGVSLLFCATDEARTLLGDELERDPAAMAAALRRRGAARVVVAGTDTVACAGRNGTVECQLGAAFAAGTFPRAAFLAGILQARLHRRPWRQSLAAGIEAAHTLGSERPADASPVTAPAPSR